MKTVYLAGPIRGQSYEQAVCWRESVKLRLAAENVLGLSPMRNKEFLMGSEEIANSYEEHPVASAKGITTRDRRDCMTSDVVIVNVAHATEVVSAGTMIEVGWADAARVPIVVVMPGGNVHDHPMLRECAGYIVNTLDEAVDIALSVLGVDL